MTSDALKRAQKRYQQKTERKEGQAKYQRRRRQRPKVQQANRDREVSPERRAYKTQKAREYRARSKPAIAYRDLQARLKELRSLDLTSISLISSRTKLEEEIRRIDPNWWKNAIAQKNLEKVD